MKHALLPLLAIALFTAPARAGNEPAAGACLDGLEALAAARYADAEKAFSQAIAADEENPVYYQARGVARTLAENFPAALSDLRRAGRLAPAQDWETSAWFAIASKMNGHPESAYTPGSAPRADLPYAIALSDLGQNYWQSRYQGSYYDKSLRTLVAAKEPYKGDFLAVTNFYVQRHLALSGASVQTLVSRLQARIRAGQYVPALQSVEPLLAANPGDSDLLAVKAQILLALGNLEGARSQYTDLLTRRATAAAYLGRARAAAAMGDPSRAGKDLAQAARLDAPAAATARQELAPLLAAAPADPQALWAKLESQAQAGASPAELKDTALALVRAMGALRIRYDERYQDRLAKLEADLQAKPNNPERMVALARFLQDESGVLEERVGPRADPKPYRTQSPADLKHDLDRAHDLVETALRDHPKNLAALTLKAHFLVLAGDYDEAETIVLQALALKQDDPDLLEDLAGLLQIQAARRISAAGNLRQIKSWSATDFDAYPPVEYTWWRLPTKEELQQAAELEKKAEHLSKLAEARLAQAAEGAGPTPTGYYYRATLLHVRGDTAGAREALTKAVAMQPDYQQAWYQLAAVCTELRDGDGAIAARAKAYSLAQTTAAAELNALWFKVPHNQFKTGRATVAEGVRLDPADPRLPAYLAVLDEAGEKPRDALAHFRMARAISDATLALRGCGFVPPEKSALPLTPEAAGFPALVRLRIAALLLDQGQPAAAVAEFTAVGSALAALPAGARQLTPPDALLPNPEPAGGTVPLADSVGFLQTRAAAGTAYAQWALAANTPEDTALAAQTYRRLLISYAMPTDTQDAIQGVADLGLAELYLHSHQIPQAIAALKSTPAVPQDFWQEMRRTEAAIRNQQQGR
jgi:Flp pilus assembly protein TadD